MPSIISEVIPQWRFIFIGLYGIARVGDGWAYNDSPLNHFCPDCNRKLTVGIHIIDELTATYYARCWGCDFDLKIKRELEDEGFDYDTFMDTI